MIDTDLIESAPPQRLLKQQRPGPLSSLNHLLRSRHQVFALVQRDFTARYKQTKFGFGWALLLPLLTILVFGVFVQRIAKADTHGVPYVLWSLVGLVAWNFFANAVNNGGQSLLTNQSLVNKVYSARQIYPVAGVLLAGVDAVVSLVALGVVCLITGFLPAATSYWVPVLAAVMLLFTAGVVLLVSILIVYVRDLRNMVPFVLQLGLFATPVVYGLDQVPQAYRLLYCFLNPMAGVIDGLRRAVLYGQNPDAAYLGAGAATAVVLFVGACWVFARFERGIVDII